jgi:hypothetical protein
MINVAVRNQNRIEPTNAVTQSLLPEISRRINQNAFSRVFDQNRNPQTVVARVFRSANLAIAADKRNARRSACAQESQFQKSGESGVSGESGESTEIKRQ